MKYILLLLLTTVGLWPSPALALHDPADSVIVVMGKDLSTGTTPNANFYTARSGGGAAGRSSSSAAADTGSAVGTVGANFVIYRSYFLGPNMESGYPDSFAVTAGNTSNITDVVFSVRATNAQYLGGCTGNIKCYLQNPLVANATGADASTVSAALWFNDIFTLGAWVPFDSITVDTTVFGLSDTLRLRFHSQTSTITNMVESMINGGGTATQPTFNFCLMACFDADSSAPSGLASDTYAFKVDYQYLETTGTTEDPGVFIYWTEVEPDETLDYFKSNPYSQLPFGTKPFNQ